MPIYMAPENQILSILKITGTDKMKKHLENLGFVPGAEVMVTNHVNNNVIIKIKGVSLAVSHDLAKRIIV